MNLVKMQRVFSNFSCYVLALSVDPVSSSDVRTFVALTLNIYRYIYIYIIILEESLVPKAVVDALSQVNRAV